MGPWWILCPPVFRSGPSMGRIGAQAQYILGCSSFSPNILLTIDTSKNLISCPTRTEFFNRLHGSCYSQFFDPIKDYMIILHPSLCSGFIEFKHQSVKWTSSSHNSHVSETLESLAVSCIFELYYAWYLSNNYLFSCPCNAYVLSHVRVFPCIFSIHWWIYIYKLCSGPEKISLCTRTHFRRSITRMEEEISDRSWTEIAWETQQDRATYISANNWKASISILIARNLLTVVPPFTSVCIPNTIAH